MNDTVGGVIWAHLPDPVRAREVALVVDGGQVVRAWPPFLGVRWVGRPVEVVRRCLTDMKAGFRWTPGVESFRPNQVDDKRAVRRWEQQGRIAAYTDTLTLGVTGGGRWYTYRTGQGGIGWLWPDFPSALAECLLRTADGTWRRVPANYGPDMTALPDEPLNSELG